MMTLLKYALLKRVHNKKKGTKSFPSNRDNNKAGNYFNAIKKTFWIKKKGMNGVFGENGGDDNIKGVMMAIRYAKLRVD